MGSRALKDQKVAPKVGNYDRPRSIVRNAAHGIDGKPHSASAMLKEDARGFWERRAVELLEKTVGQAKSLKLTDDQVDREIENRIAIEALDGLIAHAAKKAKP